MIAKLKRLSNETRATGTRAGNVRGAAGVKAVRLLVAVCRQVEIMTMEALPSLRFEVFLAVIEAKARRLLC